MTNPRPIQAADSDPPKRQVVNLVLDDRIIEALQKEADETGESRSNLVRLILRQYLGLRRSEPTAPLT